LTGKAGRRNPLHRRVDIQTAVRIGSSGDAVRAQTLDLGLGGTLCLSPRSLPIRSSHPCRIQIQDGDRKFWVEVEAQVVRSQFRPNGFKVGLKFTRINREIREALKKYLDQVEEGRTKPPS
jgi:c-di-GMP-binding flagellar brake protein YcgR